MSSVFVRVVVGLSLCGVAGALQAAELDPGAASRPAAPVTPPASAPPAPRVPVTAPGSDSPLEEVTVTARFKSESLQSAPIAITAVSQPSRWKPAGTSNVTDVAHAAPNVNLEQAGSGFGKSTFVSIAASARTTSNTRSSRVSASI